MGNSIDPCHESNQFQENSIVKFFFFVLVYVKKRLLYDDDYSGRRIQSLRF